MSIRQLSAVYPRIETGPTRFGDDWCGVFIRGDNAAYFALALRYVLGTSTADPIAIMTVHSLLELLQASDERAHGTERYADREGKDVICYRDMTFCVAKCAQYTCPRHMDHVPKDYDGPVAQADFSDTCQLYVPEQAECTADGKERE
ncbi:MAG: hypothetical protein AB7F22_25520 [Reyranella sp.]|uniref:hypothetical protein n=1 Tax=Reyranella sp. TaxID=1929291 RepID=UPI003D152E0D